MVTVIPADNWEPIPRDFPTGFSPDPIPMELPTTEEVIRRMNEIHDSKWMKEFDSMMREESSNGPVICPPDPIPVEFPTTEEIVRSMEKIHDTPWMREFDAEMRKTLLRRKDASD